MQKNIILLKENLSKPKQYRAFTLAEVLITLAIIGVIAALTLPGLINNIQNQENINSLKKAYADLSAATKYVINNNGGDMTNLCGQHGITADGQCNDVGDGSDNLTNLYTKYLHSIKYCSSTSGDNSCWYGYDIKNLSSTCTWAQSNGFVGPSKLILNNGMLVAFFYRFNNCDDVIGCGTITVDVNGFKEPNRWGYDVFQFEILKNSLVPTGTTNAYVACNRSRSDGYGTGYGCALYAMQNKSY